MSRQQKRLQREAEIIHATIELLETSSFLDLRMSDIAKAAECSMGAIYSHFTSKEDLLLGCAYRRMKEKDLLLNKLLSRDYKALEFLLMVAFTMWITDEQQPKFYQLTQLAMNPSVWQRASAGRSSDMNELGNEMQSIITSHGLQALEQRPDGVSDKTDAEQFCIGLMGLTIGIYTMKLSGFGCFEERFEDDDGLELHLTNVRHYLSGWGFNLNALGKNLEEIRENAEKFYQQEYS